MGQFYTFLASNGGYNKILISPESMMYEIEIMAGITN